LLIFYKKVQFLLYSFKWCFLLYFVPHQPSCSVNRITPKRVTS